MASPEGWADWLGVVGSVASLASFAAAGYAAVKVRDIGRHILFNVRAEDIVKGVVTLSEAFAGSLKAYPDDCRAMETHLRMCLAHLHRIKADVPSDAREHVKRAQRLADGYFASRNVQNIDRDRNTLWELNDEISIAVSLIRQSIADRRLGGYDGHQ